MAKSNISEIVNSLLSGVRGISRSETIVGAPQQAGDATVIPVHRLKIAFGAASATAGAEGSRLGGSSGGHGAGGAVELEPVAAIAVGKDGRAELLTVEGDAPSAWSSLLREVPDILTRLTHTIADRARAEIGQPAEQPRVPASERSHAEALPAATSAAEARR